ncbi:MAG: hypothetical protein GY811_23320 [Myxococcales bacterium]|nr:hypothetical protein [Myxococcales bacterium]
MTKTRRSVARNFALSLTTVAGLLACDGGAGGFGENSSSGPVADGVGSTQQAITDVPHTAVERQSIGNCWLYAQASWVESMALAANPDAPLDLSQSYWTYWHWFDQVTGWSVPDEIQTGGFQYKSHSIVRNRGLMPEGAFIPADTEAEMSSRQKAALGKINAALKNGDFDGANGKRAREIFDDAWGLSLEVRAQLDQAFSEDGESSLRQGADLSGTAIMDPTELGVRYTERVGGETVVRNATLVDAIRSWEEVRYPRDKSQRRGFLQRVQRALHDRQPVVITWDVDFNALENGAGEFQGSFNLTTLQAAGRPGGQGGHMTVLEDYEAVTQEFGLLEAGVTLGESKGAVCETFGTEVSGVVFDNEQATNVVDMADTATKEELEALNGIGAGIAQRIIDARPFATLDAPLVALDQVPYVSSTILTTLRDEVFERWCSIEDGRQTCCAQDAGKLEAALLDSTEIKFLRIKNSWGANRPGREFAPGFPGYHDLYMDYLEGPIPFCPKVENPTNETCTGESTPLRGVMLPPGY